MGTHKRVVTAAKRMLRVLRLNLSLHDRKASAIDPVCAQCACKECKASRKVVKDVEHLFL